MIVSWVYTYLQIHQVVYIQYVQHFVCHSYWNKVVWNIIRFRTLILLLNQGTLIIPFSVSEYFCTKCAVRAGKRHFLWNNYVVFLLGFLILGIFSFLKIPKCFEFICKVPGVLWPVTCFHILSSTLFWQNRGWIIKHWRVTIWKYHYNIFIIEDQEVVMVLVRKQADRYTMYLK